MPSDDVSQRLAYDEARLHPASRAFAEELFSRIPSLRASACMEYAPEVSGYALLVAAQSPSGDPERQLYVWMDEGLEPSVAFGDWHTHASVWIHEPLIDLIEAILEDQFVFLEYVGDEHSGFNAIVDLREEDALEDALTDPYAPGRGRLKSWSGAIDREISVQGFEREPGET